VPSTTSAVSAAKSRFSLLRLRAKLLWWPPRIHTPVEPSISRRLLRVDTEKSPNMVGPVGSRAEPTGPGRARQPADAPASRGTLPSSAIDKHLRPTWSPALERAVERRKAGFTLIRRGRCGRVQQQPSGAERRPGRWPPDPRPWFRGRPAMVTAVTAVLTHGPGVPPHTGPEALLRSNHGHRRSVRMGTTQRPPVLSSGAAWFRPEHHVTFLALLNSRGSPGLRHGAQWEMPRLHRKPTLLAQ
jgi:hypothetical protein